MPVIPCPSRILCPPGDGILGIDFPFANLSAEQPDGDEFIGDHYGFTWFFPPIGSNWTRNSCLGVCTSFISQADADECAAIQNLVCLIGDWGVLPGTTIDGDGSSGPPIIERLSGGRLPMFTNNLAQCTIFCPDGLPFTFQVQPGLFMASSQVLVDRIAASFACVLAERNRLCLSTLQPQACLADTYAATIRASRAVATRWTLVSGSLPPGIVMTPGSVNSLDFDGIPTVSGNYTFVILAEQIGGIFFQKTYTINVLGMTTPSLPDATEGDFYTQQLNVAGNLGAVSFSIESGALPSGLTLDGTGALFGTPTESGDFTFTVLFTDQVATTSCVKEFTLTVGPALSCPAAAGIFVVGGAQVVDASNDTTLGRVLVSSVAVGGNKLINASTGAIINGAVTSIVSGWAQWHPSTHRFVYCPTSAGVQGWRLLTEAGAESLVGDVTDLFRAPAYDWDSDLFYGAGFDSGGPTIYFTTFNPNTNAVVGKLNMGALAGGAPPFLYASTPKCVLGIDAFGVATRYSLPGFAAGPTIDFGAAPYNSWRWGVANMVTGTWFLAVLRADLRELCVEVDPATMTVIHTYDLGVTNTGSAILVCANQQTGAVYAKGTGRVTMIDGANHAILCTVLLVANQAGVAFDRFTNRMFTANFSTGNVHYYE